MAAPNGSWHFNQPLNTKLNTFHDEINTNNIIQQVIDEHDKAKSAMSMFGDNPNLDVVLSIPEVDHDGFQVWFQWKIARRPLANRGSVVIFDGTQGHYTIMSRSHVFLVVSIAHQPPPPPPLLPPRVAMERATDHNMKWSMQYLIDAWFTYHYQPKPSIFMIAIVLDDIKCAITARRWGTNRAMLVSETTKTQLDEISRWKN